MIPPHELKNKEFTRVMRGYSIPEVDEYISFVMEKYTDLYRENDALERKLQSAMDSLDAMRAEEESIRTALINAQKAGKNIVADASDRADKIMRSTKTDCLRVLAEFRDKAAAERKTLVELKTAVAVLKEELFEKYQTHIRYIEELTANAGSEAAAMQNVDNEAYVGKISDSIAALVKEDYDFDLTEEKPAAARESAREQTREIPSVRSEQDDADTQIFTKVTEDAPAVQHVTISDDRAIADDPLLDSNAQTQETPPVNSAGADQPADADTAFRNTDDADALLAALASEIKDTALVSEEEVEAVYGKPGENTKA